MDRIKLHVTEHGVPGLWEAGGGRTNIGDAFIVANRDGSRKRALYVRRSGHRACLTHALVPVRVGDILVSVHRHRDQLELHVDTIAAIEPSNEDGERWAATEKLAVGEATLNDTREGRFGGVWDHPETAEKFMDVLTAAVKKSTTYHCKEAVYVLPPEPKRKAESPGPTLHVSKAA